MAECSNGVSVSNVDQLRGVINNRQKLSEYVNSNPEEAYFELLELYSRFVVTPLKLGSMSLAHEILSEYITREHPGEDGDKAKKEMNEERGRAERTLRLLGMS